MNYIWNITPIGAPRLNRFDAWKKRPRVLRYFAFRDAVALQMKKDGIDRDKLFRLVATFFIPMPKSWSKKKHILMKNTPHQQKPDIDNMVKALLDSIFREGDDCKVYSVVALKYWTDGDGKIEITI